MVGVDRETSFSAGTVQPDGDRNRGTVVREGMSLALVTWKEERKGLISAMKLNGHYIAISDSIPS